MGFFRRLMEKLGIVASANPVVKAMIDSNIIVGERESFRQQFVTRCPMCGNGGHARQDAHKQAIGRVMQMKLAARG